MTTRSEFSAPLTVTRISAALGTLGVASVLAAGSASAHVRVTPDTARPGGYTTLTFKVPTESNTASTTKLEVDLPTDHPFGSASYQPVPGWTTKVTTSKLAEPITTDDGTIDEAPTKITWTANADAAIKPGQFQTFAISVGPVPNTGKLTFAAHQTYSDGKVVDWNQPQTGSKEPENPAPVLYITDKAPDAAGAPAASAGSSAPGATRSSAASSTRAADAAAASSSDDTARWLATAGLLVGLAGLVAAVWAATRRTRA